ncbi:MAG: LytTR family DNA-binding domain-containing protein, partial [Bacteroidota bacterium]
GRLKALQEPEDMNLPFQTLSQNYFNREEGAKRLILRDKENIYVLMVDEIVRLEGEGSYTTVFTRDGQKLVVSKNLKTYEKMLTDKGFFRPHTSHLINLAYLRKVSKKDGVMIVMADDSEIPLARRRKEELFRLLG